MAIENAKTLNVRIRNKYDSYENWAASSLVLEAGEIAIAHTTVNVTVDNGTVAHPALLMKVGDGEKTFANLPWLSAKAADVLDACKSTDALTTFVNNVIASAGIASSSAMEALTGRVTTAEGKITTLEGKMTAAEGKITTAEAAIDALELLVGDTAVATQIKNAIDELNLADTYAAKTHGHAIADVEGLDTAIAAAKKAGDNAAEALGAYKTLNDAAVQVNSDAIAAIKKDATITTFKGIEEVLAGKQAAGDYATKTEAQGYANAKDAAIQAAQKAADDAAAAAKAAQDDADALELLVGDTKVADQISGAIEDLDLTNTYAAKEHTHTKSEITDFAHNHEMGEVNGLVAALEGKQAKGDYATKAEAQGYADAKNAAIEAAQAAADKAQEEVDALETYVGTIPSDEKYADITNVVAYVNKKAEETLAAAQGGSSETAASVKLALDNYKAENDPKVQANTDAIDALELLVGDKNIAGEIEAAVAAEAAIARAAEQANAKAIDDLAKGAVKANTDAIAKLNGGVNEEGSVDYKVAQEIAKILNDNDEDIDTLEEIAAWIKNDTAGVGELNRKVSDNAAAIELLNGDATKTGSVDQKIATAITGANLGQYALDSDLDELAGRVTTIETEHDTATTGLKARLTQAEADIDALQLKVGDTDVATQIATVTDPMAEQIAALEDDSHTHGNKTVLDGITSEKVAAWDKVSEKANDADLAAIAKTGSTDDLVQGSLVLVFDCGGAGV